jgi:putative nucleotidyltransferase with HDIG domain
MGQKTKMADTHPPISNPQPQSQKVRFPIRIKITLPFLVLSILIAVGAAFLITELVIENFEERFNKQLFEAGKISAELIVSYEDQMLEAMRLLANISGVAEALQANNPEDLRSLTLGVSANNQLEAVEFIDTEGNHVLSMHHFEGGNPENYTFSTGGQDSFSTLGMVQKVLAQQSDTQGDKFAELVQLDSGDYLYLSGPVYDAQRNLTGVLMVGRNLKGIVQEIRSSTFAQITLYDPNGIVITSTLPYPQSLPAGMASEVNSYKDISSTRRDLTNVRDFEASNLTFAEILGGFEVRRNKELGVLGVSLSMNTIVQTTTASRWRIFLLVASANFLIILVGISLANQITRPLIRLVQASSKVAKGDLNVKVQTQTNDEISVLANSFNVMVDSLNMSQQELLNAYDDTLAGWAKALELRDKETKGHSIRVTELTVEIAEALGIQGEALVHIRRGALLHDVGKMGTPDAILNKPGPLTTEEWRIIHKHPQDGCDMLSHIDFLKPALEVPLCHHEKWDGTGYPAGLRGEEIPISARIFCIVDVWDALINDRPYRKAISEKEVMDYIRSQSGKHFDPRIVDAFLRIMKVEE